MAPSPCVTSTIPTPKSMAETAIDGGAAATLFSTLPPDIIQTHILSRLDGSALASAAATCSQLYALSSQEDLWVSLCHSTWPSTSSPRLHHVIRSFPHGFRSFFSDSSTIPRPITTTPRNSHINLDRTPELISAIDLYYRRELLLSKVVETETVSDWFRCSPFRVDILEPKDVVQTVVRYPENKDRCRELAEELTLSWIVIDSSGGRAMNVSSQKPVSVQRHWLSGEVEVKFASVMGGEKGSSSELALCNVLMTLIGAEGREMQVREGSLQMEDMDGMNLKGRDSLLILQRALEGKRESKNRGREGYGMFGNRKRERKEKMMRREGALDMVCVCLATLSFVGLLYNFVVCRV
ncbi:probable F-box protein At2g36090 [Neltuma alba]|uniref:probable F-box protein At2g36090 n=1 Tax=Neltuma alba TaxID=207710 RepID=UPI0010A564B7|nr:probable F-box protein At2g36090 [Prosopis alba]XP_028787688.1 probable F-box protein At2g36090 [Prosopis alba]